jgi:hypothetical protein
MNRSRKYSAIILYTCLLALSGCGLIHKNNPQLPAALANELTIADQLQQQERDYRTFFTDVGIANREGQLTDQNVSDLNAIGDRWQKVIERGNAGFKAFQADRNDSTKMAIVLAAIQEGTGLFLDLTTKKGQMQAASSTKAADKRRAP